jgi:hypothetical protein
MELDDKRARWWARNNVKRMINRHYVLCEAIRLVYDDVYLLPDGKMKDRLSERLVDMMIMSKNMSDRLHYYQAKYQDKTGKGGKGFRLLSDNQARMRMRKKRI